MNKTSAKVGPYDFLLALNAGESHNFDNKPTRQEAMRHVIPSERSAYNRVTVGVGALMRRFPDHYFSCRLAESKGSRILGNIVIVTLVGRGGDVFDQSAFDRLEMRRRNQLEHWKKKKQAEDAPKLPGQLEEAEAAEVAKRTKRAIQAQESSKLRVIPNRYDPKQIAALVAASIRGEVIERLIDGRWYLDPNPTWTEPTSSYRIKPKIREWYLVLSRDGRITASGETIEGLPHHDETCRVHVREVLPEEE